MNLLLITEETKTQYVLIKDFNKFMYNQTKHKGRKHFCMYCLQCFSSDQVLINHKENCISMNGEQAIKMPEKGSKVKFNNFNKLKLTFKALYFKQWPTYLNLQRVSTVRELRSSDCIRLQVPLEKGTFQDTTAALFNNLPKELKICDKLNLFTSRLFKFLKNRAKVRL